MTRDLKANPCNGKCEWHATSEQLEGQPLFECAGCGSEWTPDQGWTPRNADGQVTPEVAAAQTLAQGNRVVGGAEDEPSGPAGGGGSVDSW